MNGRQPIERPWRLRTQNTLEYTNSQKHETSWTKKPQGVKSRNMTKTMISPWTWKPPLESYIRCICCICLITLPYSSAVKNLESKFLSWSVCSNMFWDRLKSNFMKLKYVYIQMYCWCEKLRMSQFLSTALKKFLIWSNFRYVVIYIVNWRNVASKKAFPLCIWHKLCQTQYLSSERHIFVKRIVSLDYIACCTNTDV